mmetsp:Transcript_12915/g.15596  ORF Transcript_12915/g.15596 Transcript_12915/m.15596 type:complete len:307 (-) Transcript_12915:404-1324(-)|eukprot:CAMPEP_0197856888 /NCGR_PEP_ID=MMETSP1438-20131217/29409_1 /TAXON_ID=1461541 /ORGANISM="Pterosperma sp., Strain CCMP1384" /LENGTH=306 /DNA_ID=CAMNT_0043472507 /DNA_START=210 /DNA_END=1130 /DNA_ORIENTATION=-
MSRPSATTPVPFQLKGDAIHEESQSNLERARQARDDNAKKLRQFKARPMPKDKGAWTPDKTSRVTTPRPVALQSEARAKEREQFDNQLKAKEEEKAALEVEEQKMKEEQEKAVVEEIRKSQVFKAREMPNFDDPYTPVTSRTATGEDGSPVMELHDWNIIMAQRKQEEQEQLEAAEKLEEMNLRESLNFSARKMPSFKKVWDPRNPKRVQSGPRPNSARQSLESSSWARASDRNLETPTRSTPRSPAPGSDNDSPLAETLAKSKRTYRMIQKLDGTSPLSRGSSPGSATKPVRPKSAKPKSSPSWK